MATIVYNNVARTTSNDGDSGERLFSGIKFWLSVHVPLKSTIKERIESNGGTITVNENIADVKLTDHLTQKAVQNATAEMVSYTFVDDSIKNGAVEDLEKHRIINIANARQSANLNARRSVVTGTTYVAPASTPRPRVSGGRTEYTAQDDKILLTYLSQPNVQLQGNSIYKEIEANYPHHSYQSWRGRWVKKLSHLYPDGPVAPRDFTLPPGVLDGPTIAPTPRTPRTPIQPPTTPKVQQPQPQAKPPSPLRSAERRQSLIEQARDSTTQDEDEDEEEEDEEHPKPKLPKGPVRRTTFEYKPSIHSSRENSLPKAVSPPRQTISPIPAPVPVLAPASVPVKMENRQIEPQKNLPQAAPSEVEVQTDIVMVDLTLDDDDSTPPEQTPPELDQLSKEALDEAVLQLLQSNKANLIPEKERQMMLSIIKEEKKIAAHGGPHSYSNSKHPKTPEISKSSKAARSERETPSISTPAQKLNTSVQVTPATKLTPRGLTETPEPRVVANFSSDRQQQKAPVVPLQDNTSKSSERTILNESKISGTKRSAQAQQTLHNSFSNPNSNSKSSSYPSVSRISDTPCIVKNSQHTMMPASSANLIIPESSPIRPMVEEEAVVKSSRKRSAVSPKKGTPYSPSKRRANAKRQRREELANQVIESTPEPEELPFAPRFDKQPRSTAEPFDSPLFEPEASDTTSDEEEDEDEQAHTGNSSRREPSPELGDETLQSAQIRANLSDDDTFDSVLDREPPAAFNLPEYQEKMAKKYDVDELHVGFALERTSLDFELAEKVLQRMVKCVPGGGYETDFQLPDIPGVWTDAEDKLLRSTVPKYESMFVKKHGRALVALRRDFLEQWELVDAD